MYINKKCKTLIKIYKFLLLIIDYLNKHLHLNIIFNSFLKFINSKIFKVLRFLIKIIILINLLISFGFFFKVLELQTPLSIVSSIYMESFNKNYHFMNLIK